MKRVLFLLAINFLIFSCCTMQEKRSIVRNGFRSLIDVRYFSPSGQSASGSGCALDVETGLVLTNKHMAPEGTISMVYTRNGPEFAEVIYRHKTLDVAVLKVDPKALMNKRSIDFSLSSEPGDDVYVIGNPFEFNNVVTKGIISTKIDNILILDASMNPGNSGGLVINSYGQLVGLSFAMDMRAFDGKSFSKSGLSYAVDAAEILKILKKNKIL